MPDAPVEPADNAPEGTEKAATPPAPAESEAPKTETVALTADERAELTRLRGIHKDEKKFETYNKANLAKLRELAETLGIPREEFNPAAFDPKTELEKLRLEVETERVERTRSDIAREKGVDPRYVVGASADEMKAAADAYLTDVQARIDAALKRSTAPVTETTSTVKAGDRVEGPKQITTEAELKKLSPAEQMAAYKDGRLDKLLGR